MQIRSTSYLYPNVVASLTRLERDVAAAFPEHPQPDGCGIAGHLIQIRQLGPPRCRYPDYSIHLFGDCRTGPTLIRWLSVGKPYLLLYARVGGLIALPSGRIAPSFWFCFHLASQALPQGYFARTLSTTLRCFTSSEHSPLFSHRLLYSFRLTDILLDPYSVQWIIAGNCIILRQFTSN